MSVRHTRAVRPDRRAHRLPQPRPARHRRRPHVRHPDHPPPPVRSTRRPTCSRRPTSSCSSRWRWSPCAPRWRGSRRRSTRRPAPSGRRRSGVIRRLTIPLDPARPGGGRHPRVAVGHHRADRHPPAAPDGPRDPRHAFWVYATGLAYWGCGPVRGHHDRHVRRPRRAADPPVPGAGQRRSARDAMSEIRIEELTARYDASPVLTSVDLVVPSGSLTCVLGESGCGKTTLLRVIAGFTPARSGRVRIGDRIVDDGTTRVAPEKRRVGYVPQEGALFPHLTVADNIGFALPRRTGADRRARADTVREMLELVQMPDHGGRYPHELSGGQQQRISIARALANRARGRPARRAVRLARRHAPRPLPRGDPRGPAHGGGHRHPRHPRPLRGPVAGRPRGRDQRRPRPPDGHPDGPLHPARRCPRGHLRGRRQPPALHDRRRSGRSPPSEPLDVHPACPIGDRTSGTAVVRPEHVHVHAADEVDPTRHPGAVGVLTRAEYYGHDARLEVRLDDPRRRRSSRTRDRPHRRPGPAPRRPRPVLVCVDGTTP